MVRMASVKCPNCDAYQSIPLEELGPGCVGAPALVLGYLCNEITRLGPDEGLTGNLVLALAIEVIVILGMFICYLVNFYPVKCERCGYVSRGGKKRDR